MNASQIKYTRELLRKQRRALEAKYTTPPAKPQHIRDAEQLIQEYRNESSRRYTKVYRELEDFFTTIEMELLLTDSLGEVKDVLQRISNWKPSDAA